MQPHTFSGQPAAAVTDREQLALTGCRLLLERLTQLLRDENTLLARRESGFHGQFTERKTQLLRDLMVAERGCKSPSALAALAAPARLLKETLKRNQQLLAAHIQAVKEVSDIIVDALRQAESDGTYSRGGRA